MLNVCVIKAMHHCLSTHSLEFKTIYSLNLTQQRQPTISHSMNPNKKNVSCIFFPLYFSALILVFPGKQIHRGKMNIIHQPPFLTKCCWKMLIVLQNIFSLASFSSVLGGIYFVHHKNKPKNRSS